MRIVLCVDGGRPERLIGRAVPLVADEAEWVPVHVIDSRPRVDLGLLRVAMQGGGPIPPAHRAAIEAAGQEHAHVVVRAATAALEARGLTAAQAVIRVGEPGRNLCAAAAEMNADLVVLFASRHSDRDSSGPASVGHTARFVVDHAPCPVLIIRTP